MRPLLPYFFLPPANGNWEQREVFRAAGVASRKLFRTAKPSKTLACHSLFSLSQKLLHALVRIAVSKYGSVPGMRSTTNAAAASPPNAFNLIIKPGDASAFSHEFIPKYTIGMIRNIIRHTSVAIITRRVLCHKGTVKDYTQPSPRTT